MYKEFLVRIWMVRHGQTTWNESGRCLGRTDLPQSYKGRQAVERINTYIDISQCSTIFSSPYKRAIETARILIGKTAHNLIISEDLREIDFGIWEGIPWKTIIEKRQSEWNTWKNDPYLSNPYRGESLHNAEVRIKGFYSSLLQEYLGQTVLLVSHGGILNIFLSFLFQLPLSVIWTFKLNPASFSEILIYSNGPVLSVLNYGPNIPIEDMYIRNVKEDIPQQYETSIPHSNLLAMMQHELFI